MVLENPTKHLLGMNSFPFCGASSALISTLLLCLSLVVVIWICSICSWIEPMPREPRPRAEGGDGKQLWRAGKVGRQQETPPALLFPSSARSGAWKTLQEWLEMGRDKRTHAHLAGAAAAPLSYSHFVSLRREGLEREKGLIGTENRHKVPNTSHRKHSDCKGKVCSDQELRFWGLHYKIKRRP